MNVDENLSHYLSENIQKYTDEPNEVDIEDGDFIESNTMRGRSSMRWFDTVTYLFETHETQIKVKLLVLSKKDRNDSWSVL